MWVILVVVVVITCGDSADNIGREFLLAGNSLDGRCYSVFRFKYSSQEEFNQNYLLVSRDVFLVLELFSRMIEVSTYLFYFIYYISPTLSSWGHKE